VEQHDSRAVAALEELDAAAFDSDCTRVHDGERYRAESIRSWDSVAAAWDRSREVTQDASRDVDAWLLDRLAPSPGETIVELAAGPGDTGLQAAARLDGAGSVLLVDQSQAMVDAARRRAGELGLGELVETATMDAQQLDLPDDFADGVICRFGFMLMSDPAAALREARRVLRPGGRLVFAVWAEAERNPWALVTGPVMNDRGMLPPPTPGEPGMFVLADAGRLRELTRDAGFEHVEVAEVPVRWRYDGFDSYWDTATDMSPSMRRALAEADEGEVAAVRAAARERYGEAVEADGALPGMTYAVAAR
jgi:SAM-dependent methyltransferase